jgi:hypothetical protein
VDLAGPWRARAADDDLRRTGTGIELDDSSWPQIDVPGHWRSHPDFAGSNGPVLYRKRFEQAPPAPGARQWITFDGIFYQADVWLDGAYLGDPEGYFFPHSFEITALAAMAYEHVLAVEVTCSPERGTSGRRNITGVFQHSEAVARDWNPGGMWRSVHVHETGAVRIDRLQVLCRAAMPTTLVPTFGSTLGSTPPSRGPSACARRPTALSSARPSTRWPPARMTSSGRSTSHPRVCGGRTRSASSPSPRSTSMSSSTAR